MKPVAIPFVRQIPTLSTRHVPHALALDELMQYDAETVALYDGGGFVKLRPAAAYLNEFHWLYAIAKWAQSNVFDWVQFETEGDVVDGLEVFDWTAGNGAALIDTVSNDGTPIATVMGLKVYETPPVIAPVIHPDDNPETGAEPTPRYCVDGNDEHGCYAGDGWLPPFVIFNIEAQENLPAYYQTREAAEWSLAVLIEKGVLK
jgi:hypothetical protein